MKLPKLAIEGDNIALRQYIAVAARGSGFHVVGYSASEAATIAKDPDILVIWVAIQPEYSLSVAETDRQRPDPRNIHANVVHYCSEPFRWALQVSLFLAEIKRGAFKPDDVNQRWSGYVMPRQVKPQLTGRFSSEKISA